MPKAIDRALLHRLLWTATGRDPAARDEAAITKELATLDEAPAVFAESLEALLAQIETERPMADADAGWSWTLHVVAGLLPGAELVWNGESVRLTLPNLAHSLFIDGAAPARYRIGRVATTKLTIDAEGRGVLPVTPALESLLAACEIHCVAACCGTSAFAVAVPWMTAWLAKNGNDAGHAAARDIADLVAELEATPRAAIVSNRFNAVWPTPAACIEYLRGWQECLATSLAPNARGR